MHVKRLALVLGVALVAGIAAPAFGQPFADTPANHWAYEAFTQLAAKGLIQGYPDGTFKGDRTMTRYEMAMVVARLLARIEQQEYEVGVIYTLSKNATIRVLYRDLTMGGVDQQNTWRAALNYSF